MRQCKGMGIFKMFFWILIPLCLAGCGNRELEERIFPSVLIVQEAGIEASMQEMESQSRLYPDYGHVKAVLINKELVLDMQKLREILEYLEKRPVFARNILVLAAEDDVLAKLQLCAGDDVLARAELKKIALEDMLNFWHNHESVMEIPVLEWREDGLAVEGSVSIENESISTMGIPVAAKVEE